MLKAALKPFSTSYLPVSKSIPNTDIALDLLQIKDYPQPVGDEVEQGVFIPVKAQGVTFNVAGVVAILGGQRSEDIVSDKDLAMYRVGQSL